jgi:hypothetical protein
VGDPQQLQCVLAHSTQQQDARGMDRPLFVRLASAIEPILLRTQYRYGHPFFLCV